MRLFKERKNKKKIADQSYRKICPIYKLNSPFNTYYDNMTSLFEVVSPRNDLL